MRRIASSFVCSLLFAFPFGSAASQEVDYSQHFRVFTGQGEMVSLEEIALAMADVDAVLVGESHTDPVGHWVESEIFRLAVERFRAGSPEATRPVALSMEMFERDVQYILDEYLQDLITERQFLSNSRSWEHYEPDYRPMVELAKERGLSVIAANAPRRYVNRVSRMGRDAVLGLPSTALSFLPPLPFPEPTGAYRAEWNALMAGMTMEDQCPVPETMGAEEGRPMMPPPDEDPPAGMQMPPREEASTESRMPPTAMSGFMENGLQAQTLWDSSMGHAITTFLAMNPGGLVLHMVGGFHVANHTGTPEKVEFYRPGTRSMVVSMQPVEDINAFDLEEHTGLGDFVVLTDESLDLYVARNCGEDTGGN